MTTSRLALHTTLGLLAACGGGSRQVMESAPPPPAQVAIGPPSGDWSGICGDLLTGWQEEMPVTLTFQGTEAELTAVGTLAFVDRRAQAFLQGSKQDGRYLLEGYMDEIEGIGTHWGITLEVTWDGTTLRGTFTEIIDAGGPPELMCRFSWAR